MKSKKPYVPGTLYNAFQAKKAKAIKKAGSFKGKSNKLGQGGRAAQLKAQGVPGGVIGNLARAAHAAPGQKNFHKKGKKMKTKKKMTQAQDDAYDKAHNQKEGSPADIAQDKREGIKDKKKKKSGLRPASAVVKSEQNASHQYYKKGKKNKTKKKLDIVKSVSDTAKGAYSEGKYLLGKVGEGAKMIGGMAKASARAITGQDLKERFGHKKVMKKTRCKQHSKMGCKLCGK